MASESFTAIFEAQDNLSSALGNMASSGNNLLGTFKKIGTAAAAAFSVKKIFDFGKECLSVSREFESGMAEVFTLLPDLSNSAMADMKADIKNFAKDTGNTLSNTTSALYQAISAGVNQNDAVDFLTVANKAAVGGVSDLETAVDGLTSVTNAYGQEVLSSSRASDLMFTTVKLGKTTFGELAASLYNVVPMAVGAGVSFDDVSAALAAMTAQGMPTASATVKLRQAISELSQTGTETDKTFRRIAGKGFKDFLSEGGNLQGALQLLEAEAKKSNLGINDLFSSVEAGSAALSLTGTGTEKFTQAVQAMGNAAGATDAAYETMENTSEHKIKKMQAQWEVMKADVGAALSDALLPAMEALSANMPQITAAASEFGGLLASGVRTAIPFFTALLNNIDKIIAGAKALAVAWAGVKIANGITSIAGAAKGLGSVLGLGGMATAGAASAGATGAVTGFTSALSGLSPILAGAASSIAPVVSGLGLVAAGAVVAAKVSDEINFHWADDMLEASQAAASQVDNLNDYVNTANQLKDIELVLKNPDSSKAEIDEAKQKLQEIADLCGIEYEVTITSDTSGIDDTTAQVLDDTTNTVESNGKSGARDIYNQNKNIVEDISNDKNIQKYKNNQSGFSDALKGLTELDRQTQAYEKAMADYDRSYENFAQGYISQSEYISQADAVVKNLLGKSFREMHPEWSDDMLTGELDNYFSNTIPGTLEGNRLARPGWVTEMENNKAAVEAYEESVRNAEKSLSSGLAADVNLGNEGNIKASTKLFEDYGRGIKEAGMSTDSAAISFAYAKEGFADLESALAAGKGNEIAANFESYKKSIGDFNGEVAGASVSLSTLLNASLSASGFSTLTDALSGGDDALASLSSHMTEYARQLGSISGEQHIEISATGDISTIDDISGKISELKSASGVDVSVNASGDISVLDEASGKMQTLEGMGAASVQVNAEGNIDILDQAQQVIGTINSQTAQVSIQGNFSGQEELQAAADAAASLSPESSTIAVIGSFSGQDQIQAAVDLGGQLTDVATSETVNGVFNGKDDIAAAISYQGKLANKSVTYTVNYKQNGTPPAENAAGTSNWGGGYTYVNDQTGISDPTELIYESGRLFTLSGRNVLTYLERGAKIFTASETSKILDGNMDMLKKRLSNSEYLGLDSLTESLFGGARRIPEYGNGTTSAEDAFIAGDDGPELILGRQGSTVFPSSETNKIMRGFEDDNYRIQPPKEKSGSVQTSSNDKRIVIEINGSGSIKTDNREAAAEYVISQLKPKIIEMFEQEIYEEGDRSRDF